jgi:hypothetical protein
MVTAIEAHFVVGFVHVVFMNQIIEISRNILIETSIVTIKVLGSNHKTGIELVKKWRRFVFGRSPVLISARISAYLTYSSVVFFSCFWRL